MRLIYWVSMKRYKVVRPLVANTCLCFLAALFLLAIAMPSEAVSQEAVLDILPLRPFSIDL
jgi:hypothetical protein